MRVEMGQNDDHMLHSGWVVAKEIAEVNKMLGCGVRGGRRRATASSSLASAGWPLRPHL